jgi:hypothetical protein
MTCLFSSQPVIRVSDKTGTTNLYCEIEMLDLSSHDHIGKQNRV